jgi:hypothetical protein
VSPSPRAASRHSVIARREFTILTLADANSNISPPP